MSNNLNSNPIYVDTDMTASWRAAQTLNTGNLPATTQNPGPIPRQFGVHVTDIVLMLASTQASGTILVADPNDNTILFKQDVPASGTFQREFWFPNPRAWRDFKITGVTATGCAMEISYRA